MHEKRRKIRTAILGVLKENESGLSSTQINAELKGRGLDLSERTVRLYLQEMYTGGLCMRSGGRCHGITPLGLQETAAEGIIQRVGFLSAKIDQMTYRMNFDLNAQSGSVVVNMTVADPRQIAKHMHLMGKVFEHGYAMGELLTLMPPGEKLGHIDVPEGMVGLGTVCSITLNGVLLKYGIPTNSRFGGLLEIHNRQPKRFVEIIMYDGTSLDPLEVFIRSGMTDYLGAVKTDCGKIGASFREFPAESRGMVEDLAKRLKKIGLGGFMCIGRPGQGLLDFPVGEGRVGAIVIGGLNPVAILEESGVRVHSRALAGLIDFSRLFSYRELPSRIKAFL